MKRSISIILSCLSILFLAAGCAAEEPQTTQAPPMAQIANPWSDWASLPETESAVGFSFGIPETIADCYTADTFRTLNQELMEVIYRDGNDKIIVRKQQGEGMDISGDYTQYETCQELTQNGASVTLWHNSGSNAAKVLISCRGFSWSLVAPDGFAGDTCQDFLNAICGE